MAVDYPHGNAKHLTTAHQMTAPSVLQSLKESNGTASEIYKKKVKQYFPPGHTMLLPKNMKQISNVQYNIRQKMRLTRDALYNLHEMAYDSPQFIRRITTFPDTKKNSFTSFNMKKKKGAKMKRTLRQKTVQTYCICKLPEKTPMIACDICKMWFHGSCIQVPEVVFADPRSTWTCKDCNAGQQ